jgi:peptidoglycan glycosyltransferase
MSASQRQLGGLGALFFLASLGAIAYFVQRQEIPEERDLVRAAATVVPESTPEEPALALPWQERLDLSAAKLVGYGPPAAPLAEGAEAPAVDPASGRLVQHFNDGHRVLYTIDPVLQQSALEIFKSHEVPFAAAVVLDVRDNAILAMAGHSSMDPQVDPLEILTTAWAPAASIFKLVTASALVGSKRASAKSKECFSGGLHGITDDLLTDNPARDTRCDTLSAAVAHSHNLVIAKLALKHLDAPALLGAAKTFGFERDIPFEFPLERSPARIPAEPRERAKVAAGFWNVDMSPLHGALLASVFARDGVFQAPHVVAQVLAPDGSDGTPPAPKTERAIAREVAKSVGEMMLATTTEGTARASFRDSKGTYYIPGVAVAGKTGSLTGKKAPALNYNWFVGYAPADRPEIAFAVIVANEPKWRIKAHYAARRLVQIYLGRRDAIAEQAAARLSNDGGLILPQREAKGAPVIASAAQPAAPPVAAPAAAAAAAPSGVTSAAEPPAARPPAPPASAPHADELPPIPGAVPPGTRPVPANG